MKVVMDSNVFFAAVISKGKELQSKTLDIFFSGTQLIAPYRFLAELEKNRSVIMKKSRLQLRDFHNFVESLKELVEFVPLEKYSALLHEASGISPHEKDSEFFALALVEECFLWSEEKSFKKQDVVDVLNTVELHSSIFGE